MHLHVYMHPECLVSQACRVHYVGLMLCAVRTCASVACWCHGGAGTPRALVLCRGVRGGGGAECTRNVQPNIRAFPYQNMRRSGLGIAGGAAHRRAGAAVQKVCVSRRQGLASDCGCRACLSSALGRASHWPWRLGGAVLGRNQGRSGGPLVADTGVSSSVLLPASLEAVLSAGVGWRACGLVPETSDGPAPRVMPSGQSKEHTRYAP